MLAGVDDDMLDHEALIQLVVAGLILIGAALSFMLALAKYKAA